MLKKVLLFLLITITFSSCQRGCSRIERNFQTSERDYVIEMYSGGKVVFTDNFSGIINNSESSDGIYYWKHDTLVEVSGDYVIHSVK